MVVMGMHFFSRWSLEKGFAEFVEKRQQERVDKIIDVLEEYYADHLGWENQPEKVIQYPQQTDQNQPNDNPSVVFVKTI